jgi:hypothetical protein
MTKRLPYVHEAWFLDDGSSFPGSPIRGKEKFKAAVVKHYLGDGEHEAHRSVAFRLVGSPNTRIYRTLPHMRGSKPGLVYTSYPWHPEYDGHGTLPTLEQIEACEAAHEVEQFFEFDDIPSLPSIAVAT